MLLKTMFRRSKAFMELGYHLRALNDISFCLRTQLNLTGNANSVLAIYWEVIRKNTVRLVDLNPSVGVATALPEMETN